MAALALAEVCPDCGREWPAQFGRHNCNFTRRYVHNQAIVIEPLTGMREAVQRIAGRIEDQACRSAEYADLAGDDSPYPSVLADIDATIGYLKRYRADMQRLAGHAHRWDEDDHCSICGADGRA